MENIENQSYNMGPETNPAILTHAKELSLEENPNKKTGGGKLRLVVSMFFLAVLTFSVGFGLGIFVASSWEFNFEDLKNRLPLDSFTQLFGSVDFEKIVDDGNNNQR